MPLGHCPAAACGLDSLYRTVRRGQMWEGTVLGWNYSVVFPSLLSATELV